MVTVHAYSIKGLKVNIEQSTDTGFVFKIYESDNFNVVVFMEKSDLIKLKEVINNVQL